MERIKRKKPNRVTKEFVQDVKLLYDTFHDETKVMERMPEGLHHAARVVLRIHTVGQACEDCKWKPGYPDCHPHCERLGTSRDRRDCDDTDTTKELQRQIKQLVFLEWHQILKTQPLATKV